MTFHFELNEIELAIKKDNDTIEARRKTIREEIERQQATNRQYWQLVLDKFVLQAGGNPEDKEEVKAIKGSPAYGQEYKRIAALRKKIDPILDKRWRSSVWRENLKTLQAQKAEILRKVSWWSHSHEYLEAIKSRAAARLARINALQA
jgi:hypothetical protein